MTTIDEIIREAESLKMILKRNKNPACFQTALETVFAEIAASHLASGNINAMRQNL
jgi:hypothetical protein